MSDAPPQFSHKRALRAGLAAFVGTTIEWYDFYVYATAAALVFGPLFFPQGDPVVGIAAAFLVSTLGLATAGDAKRWSLVGGGTQGHIVNGLMAPIQAAAGTATTASRMPSHACATTRCSFRRSRSAS